MRRRCARWCRLTAGGAAFHEGEPSVRAATGLDEDNNGVVGAGRRGRRRAGDEHDGDLNWQVLIFDAVHADRAVGHDRNRSHFARRRYQDLQNILRPPAARYVYPGDLLAGARLTAVDLPGVGVAGGRRVGGGQRRVVAAWARRRGGSGRGGGRRRRGDG